MSWWIESKISSRYSISILWLNLNTQVKHLDLTQILESRILTWIESWRVENSTWSRWLDSTRSVYMQDSFILFFNNDIYLICWFEWSLEIWKQFIDAHNILSLHCHVCNFTSIISIIDKIWFAKYICKHIDISFCLKQKISLNKVIQIFNLNIDNWKLSTIYLES